MRRLLFFVMTILTVGAFSGVTYANQNKEKNEIGINRYQLGNREVAVKDIIITEPEAGLYKKNKSLYLKADHLCFEDNMDFEVIKGNIKIKKIEVRNNVIKITVDKESTEASQIKITNISLYIERSLPDGIYSLDLITEGGEEFPNNLLGDLHDEKVQANKSAISSVSLLDNFVEIMTPSPSGIYTDQLSVKMGDDYMYVNSQKLEMERAYVSDGYVMLPVRAVIEALSDRAVVKWDDVNREITIFMGSRVVSMKVGSKQMNLNGTLVPLSGNVEVRNSRAFLPLRDLGYALGLDDEKIHWDEETKTATLN